MMTGSGTEKESESPPQGTLGLLLLLNPLD